MAQSNAIMWFRQDLRLLDNPALTEASKSDNCLFIYILDTSQSQGQFFPGKASLIWLHHSLEKLNKSLNGQLNYYIGDPVKILPQLAELFKINHIYWNSVFQPFEHNQSLKIKDVFKSNTHTNCKEFNDSLLWNPETILKKDGSAYKIFTPYYQKGCLSSPSQPRLPFDKPHLPQGIIDPNALSISQLNLIPKHQYAHTLQKYITAGESNALNKLKLFIDKNYLDYKKNRDFPAFNSTSKLSEHLHFGELSPHQIWHAISTQFTIDIVQNIAQNHYLRELAWREFAYYLLYHYPNIPIDNFQTKFNHFEWETDLKNLTHWQKGQTGYPIIDAGMRELWQTGAMHNRVRMLVGSFLVKNLRIHWRHGAKWFWDCLFDADLANNSFNWQWIAGTGTDAAPYFRIFNPTTQAKKFDPEGLYIKKYIPELKALPTPYLFEPWKAPEQILKMANIKLGQNYPLPIIDLKCSREAALNQFSKLSKAHKNRE